VAQVTEVADPYPANRKAEYGISAPQLTPLLIMVRRNAPKVYPPDLCRTLPDHLGTTPDGRDVIMVKVVVAYRDDIGRLRYLGIA